MKKWLKRIVAVSALLLLALLGAGGYLTYLVKSRTPGHLLDADGFKIFYTDEGQGEPVILVHGLGANADLNWRRAGITTALATDFRVVAMDIRGHGLSQTSHEPKDYGIEMVKDVFRLMDHLDIERAHIAGYSLGGFIALKCVAEHPERIISAAYCASGWKDPDGPEDILSPYRRPQQQSRLWQHDMDLFLQPPSPQTLSPYRIISAKTDSFLSGPVDWVRHYIGDSIVDRQSIRAMKKAFRDFIVTREQLANMKIPSICFIGTNDGLYPYAEDLHKVQPAVELVVLDDVNHITLAMSDEFHTRLIKFLKEHRLDKPAAPAT